MTVKNTKKLFNTIFFDNMVEFLDVNDEKKSHAVSVHAISIIPNYLYLLFCLS